MNNIEKYKISLIFNVLIDFALIIVSFFLIKYGSFVETTAIVVIGIFVVLYAVAYAIFTQNISFTFCIGILIWLFIIIMGRNFTFIFNALIGWLIIYNGIIKLNMYKILNVNKNSTLNVQDILYIIVILAGIYVAIFSAVSAIGIICLIVSVICFASNAFELIELNRKYY